MDLHVIDTVPDEHHVSRHCPDKVYPGGDLQATAFMGRPSEEGVSVNWLELLGCSSSDEALLEVLRAFRAKGRKAGPKSWMALLAVGQARKLVLSETPDHKELAFVHVPEPHDPSHWGDTGDGGTRRVRRRATRRSGAATTGAPGCGPASSPHRVSATSGRAQLITRLSRGAFLEIPAIG